MNSRSVFDDLGPSKTSWVLFWEQMGRHNCGLLCKSRQGGRGGELETKELWDSLFSKLPCLGS
eukprot:7599185-Pyramimonas_sp.AAC.1